MAHTTTILNRTRYMDRRANFVSIALGVYVALGETLTAAELGLDDDIDFLLIVPNGAVGSTTPVTYDATTNLLKHWAAYNGVETAGGVDLTGTVVHALAVGGGEDG